MNTKRSSLFGIPLIAIEGELETASVWRLAPLMLDCLAPRGDRLIIDLSRCPYRDSGGIGLFLRLLFEVIDGCWVAIVGANRALTRVFDLTGLASHRNFYACASARELREVLGEGGGGWRDGFGQGSPLDETPGGSQLLNQPATSKSATFVSRRLSTAAWPRPAWCSR